MLGNARRRSAVLGVYDVVLGGARRCLCATLRSFCGGWLAVVGGGPRYSAVHAAQARSLL